MPGIILNTVFVLSHLFLTVAQRHLLYYYLYFRDVEILGVER